MKLCRLLDEKMASVVNMSARSMAKKILSFRAIQCYSGLRGISSEKKKDGAAISTSLSKEAIPDFTKPETQNWVSYGFKRDNETDDLNAMHNFFFMSITLCLVVGGMFYAYFPDFKTRDWSNREAFLELRRREMNGLPLIDRNYVDPAKITLPSDEELGNQEIII